MIKNVRIPERDSIWESQSITSVQHFEDIAKAIRFDERVHDDVKKRYEVVKKLLVYSYYEYDFLDVALDESVLTFEMALKQRYLEIMGVPPRDKKHPDRDMGLYDMIEWGSQQSLFEVDVAVIHSLRKIRNASAHPKQYQLAGIAGSNIPARVAQIISELYDNVELRKARKRREQEVNEGFKGIEATGAVLEIDGKRYLIFLAQLLHYENRLQPEIYHFAFWRIFDPANCSTEECDPGIPVLVSCNKYTTNGHEHRLSDINGRQVGIKKIENEADTMRYRQWLKFYRGYTDMPIRVDIEMKLGKERMKLKKEYHHRLLTERGRLT